VYPPYLLPPLTSGQVPLTPSSRRQNGRVSGRMRILSRRRSARA
jgi:hypothetical protein